jgi:uncharacterized membrane protein YGL010W
MQTPEERLEHLRLSGLLQRICVRYRKELPSGTTSVILTTLDNKVQLSAFGWGGQPVGAIPNERTSPAFLDDLTESFARVKSPGPEGISAAV